MTPPPEDGNRTGPLPVLPFASHFSEEYIANFHKSRRKLKRIVRATLEDLAASWALIYDDWDDARIAVDGGPMKIEVIDEARVDNFIARHGRESPQAAKAYGGLDMLEAVWIATPGALYYITPRLQFISRWEWRYVVLRQLELTDEWATLGLRMPDSESEVVAQAARSGGVNLLAIAAFYGAAD